MKALELRGLSAFHGEAQVLFDVDLALEPGEVVALVGRNGAGKTSLLRAAMGLGARTQGRVVLNGEDLTGAPPHVRARRGLGYVPEDRRIFTDLTVAENLRFVARAVPGGFGEADLLDLFPNLAPMLDRPAGAMSGGEQQMLAVARTLAANPRVVLLDEPSEGIAPIIVAGMRTAILAMRQRGVTVLVSEQNLGFVASIADRALLIEQGRLAGQAARAELLQPSAAVQRVLGV
ncbi:MAG: ABC transporter ATP-binding protein [Burkholderiaceae bacterium]|jgi:branched-chain amino acid transport system ATP-binding protein|nr:ABC transporter ATP-binding protein [Burkholderiaceae bacterium]MDH5207480.1 ABC transporter ATP-binding protein [Burkholderiaceae bacterium]